MLDSSRLLHRLLKPPLMHVDHVQRMGVDLFNAACEKDLEGIVAKLANGVHEPKARTWVKDQESRLITS